ncbi:MAG: hypothetical protein C3F13_05840 [Anaerolineales bacterium]|nr:lysoplasmalogenase [Anaerolineae bacterium]PWB54973.1 MAG: hypothetical protein C3F13_05840 [Anaerolineales bacterium]
MSIYPLIIALVLAVLNWVAVEKHWKTLEYFAKPGTMLALLWWIGQSAGWGGSMLWFTLGAVFCLGGDVFLMLPEKYFILGLISFLIGHICYVVGFNNSAPYINLLGIVLIVALAIYLGWLYPKLAAGLAEKEKAALKIPVLVYSLVISLMVYSAVLTWTRPGWPMFAALSASIGAVLFFASDSILAWDRFIKRFAHARLLTMITYHLGQIGIILSAILYAGTK